MQSDSEEWTKEAKHVFSKAAPELTADVETATQYLVEERGHRESAARRLAQFLVEHDSDDLDERAQENTQDDTQERTSP